MQPAGYRGVFELIRTKNIVAKTSQRPRFRQTLRLTQNPSVDVTNEAQTALKVLKLPVSNRGDKCPKAQRLKKKLSELQFVVLNAYQVLTAQ